MSSFRTIFKATVLVSTLAIVFVGPAMGQSTPANPYGLEIGQTPAVQIAAQYDITHANAPPGGCGCFWMQGGGGQLEFALGTKLSLVADLHATKASSINGTDENISVFNDVFGARYSRRHYGRLTLYGQAMAGMSEVFSNYPIYKNGLLSFATQAGGGADYRLTRRYSFRVAEIDWINSKAINGSNNRQNNIRFSSGVSVRFNVR